jgi:hypothetical protein
MVKVSVKVRSGTARFRVGVTAQSVRRALRLVGGNLAEASSRPDAFHP